MSEIIIDINTFLNAKKLKKVENKEHYVRFYKKVNKESDIENQKDNKVNCYI